MTMRLQDDEKAMALDYLFSATAGDENLPRHLVSGIPAWDVLEEKVLRHILATGQDAEFARQLAGFAVGHYRAANPGRAGEVRYPDAVISAEMAAKATETLEVLPPERRCRSEVARGLIPWLEERMRRYCLRIDGAWLETQAVELARMAVYGHTEPVDIDWRAF